MKAIINQNNIIENIMNELNINERKVSAHSVTVSDAKESLKRNINSKLKYFMYRDEVLCDYFNLDYNNIKNNDISIFDLIEESRKTTLENDVILSIESLKDFYFYNNRGCEFIRGESLIIPLIEYYYHKKDNIDMVDMNRDEPLKYKIYDFGYLKIMSGNDCCNHRLYGLSQAFDILKDTQFNIRELKRIKIKSKSLKYIESILNFILVPLSKGNFIISSFTNDMIELKYKNIKFIFLHNDIKNKFESRILKNFIENLEYWDKLLNGTNVNTIYIKNNNFYDNEIKIEFYVKDICKSLIIKEFELDSLYIKNINCKLYQIVRYWLNFYIFKLYFSGNNLVLKNINNGYEKQYYLNKFYKSLI